MIVYDFTMFCSLNFKKKSWAIGKLPHVIWIWGTREEKKEEMDIIGGGCVERRWTGEKIQA
jgi:hypothetical protein